VAGNGDVAFGSVDELRLCHGIAALPQQALQLGGNPFIAAGGDSRMNLFDLLGQKRGIASAAQADYGKIFREAGGYPECIGPDGPGGAKDGNFLHQLNLKERVILAPIPVGC